MAHYIQKLIDQGEHQHLDFKFEISDARKIAKSLVAFANTDGGKLLIGVKDNGVITGVSTDEEQYMIDAAASYYCTPVVPYTIHKWVLDGKAVLEIDIPEGENKPYFVKLRDMPPEAYIRIHDENIKACNIHLIALKMRHKSNGIFIKNTEEEIKVVRYLEEHPFITLNMACRLLLLSRKKTEQLLANLVYLNLLRVIYNEGNITFELPDSN